MQSRRLPSNRVHKQLRRECENSLGGTQKWNTKLSRKLRMTLGWSWKVRRVCLATADHSASTKVRIRSSPVTRKLSVAFWSNTRRSDRLCLRSVLTRLRSNLVHSRLSRQLPTTRRVVRKIAWSSSRRRIQILCETCRYRMRLTCVFCPFCGERIWPRTILALLSFGFVSLLVAGALVLP